MRLVTTISLVITLLLTAACSQEKWQTTDISGMMPPLTFTLTNEDGRHVTAADYRGKANLLYFGFTHCQSVCPTTLARIAKLLGRLDKQQRRKIQVLFVSVDPKRDTPEKLKQYTANFGPDFIGLTGTQAQLRAMAKRYRVTYGYSKPDANGNYVVSHAASIYGFAPGGDIKVMIRTTDKDAAVLADLKQLIQAS